MFYPNRPTVTEKLIQAVYAKVIARMDMKMESKGRGGFVNQFEILGKLSEENYELVQAIHENKHPGKKQKHYDKIMEELADVAITAMFGMASIDAIRGNDSLE